jgi:hypothetical protein
MRLRKPQNQEMKFRVLAVGVVWAASLFGQKHFNWQNYCFDHSASPACPGHEYAIKKPAKGAPTGVANPSPTASRSVTLSQMAAGGIDWRFADPDADALAGFNFKGLAASPLAQDLIAQLGAGQGFTEADIRKIFDGLSGVDKVAFSVRDNRIVIMVTGDVTDLTQPAPNTGLKVTPISGSAMLVGHADAVDQAAQRIAMNGPPPDLTSFAMERQAHSEFWAAGPAALVGPEAVSAGVKRFSLTVSIGKRLASDMAFEFDQVPGADTLERFQTTLGSATPEGALVHVKMSMEADEVQQRFGPVAASPLGLQLASLVKGARYLPVRDITVPRKIRPMIFGLDGGPKEVNQLPNR